ncbi:hypothetical protein BN975_04785 [Mycolicibacterium farcinogenes]|nr:hypothetical protein BN975_04785 [Mycolicibacterium farcinogenes]
MQAAVQLIDPGPHRQRTAAAVDRQLAARRRRHGIDEHGVALGLTQRRVVEHHPGGLAGTGRGTHCGNRQVGTLRLGGPYLFGDRQDVAAAVALELITIDELLNGGCDGVQATADRGDQQEWPYEEARVEVQSLQESAVVRGSDLWPRLRSLALIGGCRRVLAHGSSVVERSSIRVVVRTASAVPGNRPPVFSRPCARRSPSGWPSPRSTGFSGPARIGRRGRRCVLRRGSRPAPPRRTTRRP